MGQSHHALSGLADPVLRVPSTIGPGRVVWHDSVADWFIDKLHNGDSTIGWEGDPQLFVIAEATDQGTIWELWRTEDNGLKSLIDKSPPGYPFDERVLVRLCEIDQRRNPHRDLHKEVMEHNQKLDDQQQEAQDEWVAEEIAPRLWRALAKDGY